MKFGSLDLNVKFGAMAVQKVMQGAKEVWSKWTYHTGNLVKMTSNSAPSPFMAWVDNGAVGTVSGSPYSVFDGNTNTYYRVTNGYATAIYVYLDFGQAIKIDELTYRMDASGQSTYQNQILGIKADGSTVTLKNNSTMTGTLSVGDGNEYIAVCFSAHGRTDLSISFYELQITKWWQKG